MSDYKTYNATNQVEARQLDDDETVVTASGALDARKGDYVIREDDGTVRVASKDEFEKAYRTGGGSTRSSLTSPKKDNAGDSPKE